MKQIFFCLLVVVLVSCSAKPQDESGLVRHFVSFRFKANVSQDLQDAVFEKFMALKDLCVNPITNENYVVSLDAGSANSPEGLDQNMTQVSFFCFCQHTYIGLHCYLSQPTRPQLLCWSPSF
jgi:hypothetical protein